MTTHLWLTTALAAERAAHHPTTVRQAAEAGVLHGYQRVTGGRWKFPPRVRGCLGCRGVLRAQERRRMTTLGLHTRPDRCAHGFASVQHPDLCAAPPRRVARLRRRHPRSR